MQYLNENLEDFENIKIKFKNNLYKKVKAHLLQNTKEQVCFILGNISVGEKSLVIIPEKIIVIDNDITTDEKLYKSSPASVNMNYEVLNKVYEIFARSDYQAIINCHSHPFSSSGAVSFSAIDDKDDKRECDYLYNDFRKAKQTMKQNDDIFHLSLVFGQNSIAARTYNVKNDEFRFIDVIEILNKPIKIILPSNSPFNKNKSSNKQMRQVQAFGKEGQKRINKIKVGVVGVGGVGSIVAEGLIRLGVKDIVLIDNDKLEEVNMCRWQGAHNSDIGKPKVEIAKKRLLEYEPDVKVETINSDLFTQETVNKIKNLDCILGCTDNHPTMYFLNRLAMQYLIPFVDGGGEIISEDGEIKDINYRTTTVIPSITECMDCSDIEYYDKNNIQNFFLNPISRNNLESAGYIESDNDVIETGIYPLDLGIASVMLFEFVDLFFNYKETTVCNMFQYLKLNEDYIKNVNKNVYDTAPDDECLFCNDYIGQGDKESLDYFLTEREFQLPNSDSIEESKQFVMPKKEG